MRPTNTHVHAHPHALDIPDPADRTPNDPGVLIESKHIRAFFELRERDLAEESNADGRYDYYARAAKLRFWNVLRVGNGALLTSPVNMDIHVNAAT